MARPRSDIEPRIVSAARRRFLEAGVDGASLRQIAADARTSIGMVYYYFPTKDDLFFGVVEEMYGKLLADMTKALEPDLPVKDRIRRLYERVGAVSEDELATLRLVLREILVSSSRFDRLLSRFQRGHVPLVFATLAEGVKDGSLRADLPPPILFLCTLGVGALPQLFQRAIGKRLPFAASREGSGTEAQGAQLSAQLVDVLFDGVGSKGPRGHAPSKPLASRSRRLVTR
jgi:AcrR family transcriptional regulator